MLFLKIVFWICISLWVVSNGYVTFTRSAAEMKEELVDGQCLIGKISANTFYCLAWGMKLLKHAIA